MIPIPPDVIGPGIEEEYADALAAIGSIRAALGERPLTNHTPDGRLLLDLSWFEQEIGRRRLPIPVGRTYAATVSALIAGCDLDSVPGLPVPLRHLSTVIDGVGLLKPRHYPPLLAMIDDLVTDARPLRSALTEQERWLMDDMAEVGRGLANGSLALPIEYAAHPWYDTEMERPTLDTGVPDFSNRFYDIAEAVFAEMRPAALRKPPLAAPVAGLPPEPLPLPPDLDL